MQRRQDIGDEAGYNRIKIHHLNQTIMKKSICAKCLGIKLTTRHCRPCDRGPEEQARFEALKKKPSFALALQNMNEFGGCGVACKGVRKGFQLLLPIYTDPLFTGRLMQLITAIKKHDKEGGHGRRSILFSTTRPLWESLVFNKKDMTMDIVRFIRNVSHAASRAEATIRVDDFRLRCSDIPRSAYYYRLLNHLSVVSDYHFNEETGCYEPGNALDGASAYVYSDYIPVNDSLTIELTAAFPEGMVVGDDCSVLQCIGIEFYLPNGMGYLLCAKGHSLAIKEVF